MVPSVLITGATKGIGRACAERFASAGYRVTAVARSADDLDELTGRIGATTIVADLSTTVGIDAVPRGPYDVVILNAAAYAPGTLLAQEDVFESLLPLNLLANHRLGRKLLPPMIGRNRGHLIVIGSTGTDDWPGHMTAYITTKYALRGLFKGWQKALAGTQVQCSLISPGATLTASWENETPPDNILRPEMVAKRVWEAVDRGITGRITVTA